MAVNLACIPSGINAVTIAGMLSCANPLWAQRDPHQAMQVHIECDRSRCATKSIAYLTLVGDGKLVPDSNR